MITVQVKDLANIFGVSERTARRKKRIYMDILGRETKTLTVFDLLRLEDIPISEIMASCPHLRPKSDITGHNWTQPARG